MSVNIFHKTGSGTGTLQKVAGNTVILDANVSEVREDTINIPIISANSSEPVSVTFATPMPDTNYVVNFDSGSTAVIYLPQNKSTTGFTIRASNTRNESLAAHTVHYYAFKPIPMDGYTELQNKVNNPDNMPTQNSDNLVKSGGVFEALKDAGTVFTGTKAEWEALDPTDQERYEVVCITDDEESGIVDEYSLDEVKTNKVWIDGKPIYRKAISLDIATYTDISPRREFSHEVNLGNINVINAGGFWKVLENTTNPSSIGFQMPFTQVNTLYGTVLSVAASSYVRSLNGQTTFVVQLNTTTTAGTSTKINLQAFIEYTKTE